MLRFSKSNLSLEWKLKVSYLAYARDEDDDSALIRHWDKMSKKGRERAFNCSNCLLPTRERERERNAGNKLLENKEISLVEVV